MAVEKESKVEPKKKSKKRILRWVLLGVAALLVLLVALVPVFVSSGAARRMILARVNESVAGTMDFSRLSMSWWKGVEVSDLSFDDDAGRTSVRVRQISTKPHYGSLLVGSLSFGQTLVDEPRVELRIAEPTPAKEPTPEEAPAAGVLPPVALPVERLDLTVKDGGLKVTGPKARTAEISQINSQVSLRPPGGQSSFAVDMTVADDGQAGKLHADGRLTPDKKTGWSLKGTSGDFFVEVDDLDLASLGSIFALAGVEVDAKGTLSSNIKAEIKEGEVTAVSGNITAKDLDVTGAALKGDHLKTSVLDVGVKLRGQKELINIDELRVHSDWVDANATGVVPMTAKSLAELARADSPYSLKCDFECDVAEALSQMPATFGLQEGMQVTSGRLSGKVETTTTGGKKGISGSGKLIELAGVMDGKKIALSEPVKADVLVTSDEAGVTFEKLDASSSFAQVGCTGTSKLLKYNAGVDLGKLQSELGQFVSLGPYKMAGQLSSTGEVSSDKDRITAKGAATVKELRLDSSEGVSASEPQANVDFSVAFESEAKILELSSVSVRAGLGEVTVSDGSVPLGEDAAEPLKLTVSANKVDLAKVQPFAVLVGAFEKDVQLGGIVDSQVSVAAQEDGYRVSTEATRIQDPKVTYPGKAPFEQEEVSVAADVRLNPATETVDIKKLEVISPQIKIRKGKFSRAVKDDTEKLAGQAELEYDWSAVEAIAKPYLPVGLKMEGKRTDSVSFSSEYPAGQRDRLMANLTGKAALGFDNAEYMGLHFGPTETAIEMKSGLLTMPPFTTKVNEGQLSLAAKADFKQTPPLLQTPRPMDVVNDVRVNDETARQLLMYLNPIFAGAANMSGKVSLSCEQLAIPLGTAAKKQIQVIGTVSGEDIRLSSGNLLSELLAVGNVSLGRQVITLRPTRFVLWDGFLRYDDMQIDVGDNPLNFKGVIGLDKTLNMTATLPYTIEGKTVKVGQEADPKRISVPLKGTVDKPELDLSKLLESRLRKELEEKIFEGLDKIFK
ncbi:MAG: translocation/assembly module TamB domain-containing protein [Planctomycetota bacterium]|jgi:hypothetical protein